jgi:hypothetical protein
MRGSTLETTMKQLLTGVALAALVAIAMPGSAQARAHHHHGWWYGPWIWGSVHAKSDFVANQLNREEMGRIGYKGAVQ